MGSGFGTVEVEFRKHHSITWSRDAECEEARGHTLAALQADFQGSKLQLCQYVTRLNHYMYSHRSGNTRACDTGACIKLTHMKQVFQRNQQVDVGRLAAT